MLQALRYLLASDQEAAGKGPGSFMDAADAGIEQRVGLVLAHSVQSELGSLGSKLEEDEQLLRSCKPGSTEAAAVAFRIEKKKVLAACLAQLTGGGAQAQRQAQPQQQPVTN